MKRYFSFIIIYAASLLLHVSVFASVYYISPSGSDNFGSGTTYNPWRTLKKGMASMAGGDTLVVKDGTYTGTDNQITATQRPPAGNGAAWTVIKAEHDGEAVFDGENILSMLYVSYIGDNGIHDPRDAYARPMYYQFEGLLWARQAGSSPFFQRSRFVKFLRCGTYDTSDGGNANFTANRCADFLYENCYSYGSGRYKFLIYCSTQTIVRQCVARADRCNPSEVFALFSMYSAVNCEVQNCIAIDSDQVAHYTNVEGYSGSFCNPSTDADSLNVTWKNCVALNNALGGITCSGQWYHSNNIVFDNCVLWDISNNYETLNYIRGLNDVINQCTFGVFHSTSGSCGFNSYDANGVDTNATMKNSILYNFTGMLCQSGPALMNDVEHTDYLSLYANDTNAGAGGAHNLTNISPVWSHSNPSGALKYIIRTETGNSLSTRGEGGVQIGANCLKMVGAPGTLWGEPGYNAEQETNMWPFPNEKLIRDKMKSYRGGGVSGDRGFCKDGTSLTKYIWEYLGNPMPQDIYGNIPVPIEGTTSTIDLGEAVVVGSLQGRGTINPDNGDAARIYFKGTTVGTFTCRIFTVNGDLVWKEVQDSVIGGEFLWHPDKVASGTYIAYIKGPGLAAKKKITVIR